MALEPAPDPDRHLPDQHGVTAPPPQVAGYVPWRAGNGTEIAVWRPAADQPELRAWYRPFDALATRAREAVPPRFVPADRVTFVGRVQASRWWPELHVYAGALPHQQLIVAADGQPYEPKRDRSRKLGYRFDRVALDVAVVRTGLACPEPRGRPGGGGHEPPPWARSYEDDRSLPERWRRGPL